MAVNVNIVLLVVDQENMLSNRLDVLNLMTLDPVHICRCLLLFMQVLKPPDISQIVLPHELVRVLGCLLNFCQYLDLVEIDFGRSGRLDQLQSTLVLEHASLLGSERSTGLLHGKPLELCGLLPDNLDLAAHRFAQLIKAVVDDDFEVFKFAVQDMMRRLLVSLLLDHFNVAIDDLLPLLGVKLGELFLAATQRIRSSCCRCSTHCRSHFIANRVDYRDRLHGALRVVDRFGAYVVLALGLLHRLDLYQALIDLGQRQLFIIAN